MSSAESKAAVSKKDTDLDKAVADIHLLFQSYSDLALQNRHKDKKIEDLSRELTKSQELEKEAQNSIKQLHDMRDRLQSMLGKRCDLQDENKSLQDLLCEKETLLKEEKQRYESQLVEVKNSVEMMEEKHAEEIANIQSTAEAERNNEVQLLERTLQDKAAEVKLLQKQLADAERDRHTEIVKLRLEYDAKLMKLQKESHTKAHQMQQQSTKSSTASNALLRQKMLNEKAASTQEVNILKRTIADLQRELRATQQHYDTGNKKRRY